MKLSVSAWCLQEILFNGRIGISDFIKFCYENKVDAVELLDCFFKNDAQVQETKKYLDGICIPVSAYSIANNFVKRNREDRKRQIEYIKKGVDTAVFLETKVLRVFSGDIDEDKDITYEEGKKWIIECFNECAGYAEEKSMVMALENHGLFAGKSAQVIELIETINSPSLRANADTGNFLLVGEDSLKAVTDLRDYIAFIHFKDFKTARKGEEGFEALDGTIYQGAVIGAGEVPMKEIVDFLHRTGYTGYLSLEFEGLGDPVKGTAESIEFVKSIIK